MHPPKHTHRPTRARAHTHTHRYTNVHNVWLLRYREHAACMWLYKGFTSSVRKARHYDADSPGVWGISVRGVVNLSPWDGESQPVGWENLAPVVGSPARGVGNISPGVENLIPWGRLNKPNYFQKWCQEIQHKQHFKLKPGAESFTGSLRITALSALATE